MARRPDPLPLEVPVPASVLERRRLELRCLAPMTGLGAHRHRRMGQSLEFREYREYQRGDDARTIDWSASRRQARLIVRTFEAEERRTLFIIVDCRPAMWLPEGVDKLTISFWITQCLYVAAQAEGDRVILGTLFGSSDVKPVTLGGAHGLRTLLQTANEIRRARPQSESDWQAELVPDIVPIRRLFNPASAVVLLTDALFKDSSGACRELAQAAQHSYRSFHIVELDSWPMERTLMERGPFRLGALGRRGASGTLTEMSEVQLAETEAAMHHHRSRMKRNFRGPGLVWPRQPLTWPAQVPVGTNEVTDWFCQAYLHAQFLPSLWSRTP